MTSTTQRNKARVAAFKLPKLAQTADAVLYERALERTIDELDSEVQSLDYALYEARADVKAGAKRYQVLYWRAAVLLLVAFWLPVLIELL